MTTESSENGAITLLSQNIS